MFENFDPEKLNILTGEQLGESGITAIEVTAPGFPRRRFDIANGDFLVVDPTIDRLLVCIADDKRMPAIYVYKCSGIAELTLYKKPDPLPEFQPEDLNPAIGLLMNSKKLRLP